MRKKIGSELGGAIAAIVVLATMGIASVAGTAILLDRQVPARALVKTSPNYIYPVAPGDTVADRELGQIDFFHNSGNFLDAESLALSPVATLFAGLAVDTSSIPNRVYVADTVNNRVLGWASEVALVNNRPADLVIGQPDFFTSTCLVTPSAASLCAPAGIAVDTSGNVYVADNGNNRVLEYNTPFVVTGAAGSGDAIADTVYGQSNNFTSKLCNFGAVGSANQFSLCGPQGVAVDGMGHLYIADNKNNRVLEYDFPTVSTVATRVFGQAGSFTTIGANKGGIGAASLSAPAGIATDTLNELWVADSLNNRVLEYNTPLTSQTANKVVGQGAFNTAAAGTNSTTLSKPVAVDLDGANRLYVADQSNNRVMEYNSVAATSSAATQVFGQLGITTAKACNVGGTPSALGLCVPSAVALDSGNNLFIRDTANNRVLKYNSPLSDQSADLVLGQPDFAHNLANIPDGSGLSGPNAVAIDTSVSPARIWVADTNNNRVLGYNNAAAFANGAPANFVLGQADFFANQPNRGLASAIASTMEGPLAVAVDKSGNVYVADSANDRVLIFKAPITNGMAAIKALGQPNLTTTGCNTGVVVTAQNMCFPQGIAVDSLGNVYVSDTSNNRVLEYNTPLTSDTTADMEFGQPDFNNAECNFSSIISAAHLCTPEGIYVDSSNNLWVADGGNSRVLEYNNPVSTHDTTADKVFGQTSFTTNNGNVSQSAINFPTGVAVDSSGRVYIADTGNHRVIGFKTQTVSSNVANIVFGQGGFFTIGLANFGGNPSPETLDNPAGLAADAAGNLYVADQGNNRVLAFNAPLAAPAPTPVPQPLSINPASLNFNKVNRNTSAILKVTVKNIGTSPILMNGVSRTGTNVNDFTQVNNCIGSLAVAASCTITVTFTPTAAALTAESVTLKLWDSATGSPQSIAVAGTAVADPTVTPASLPAFATTKVGNTSTSQTVTVTNSQTAAITVSAAFAGTNPGDFVRTGGTCGASLGTASCTILVAFKPTATGARSAKLVVTTSSDPASPHSVALSGTGS